MKKTTTILFFAALLTITACKKKDSTVENPNELKQTIKLHGTVVDQDLHPLTGAIVSFNGKTFSSNSGFYVFDDATITAGRQVVKATLPGYFDAVVGFEATQSTSAQVKITLVKKVLTGNIDATTGGTVTNGAAQVTLSANGLQMANGSAFSGTANLYTYHYNPADANFSQNTPGGDLNARNSNGDEKQLMTYGMLSVKMEDASGNELQVASGQTATIKLPIDAAQLASSPATIKLWHLDETTGIWMEQGTATKQGNFYVGTVSHFSTWNCDHEETVAWVKGKVVDCNGNVISNADASVADATPGSGNRPQNSIQLENQGLFIMKVASGFPLTVSVYPYGDRNNPVNISIPPLAPGQTYDVGTITGPCGSKVTGKLVDCNGNAVRGMVRVENGLSQANIDVWNGELAIELALNTTYTIVPYCMAGALFGNAVTINTGSTITTIDKGNIPTCPCNGTGGNTQTDLTHDFFTVNGAGFSNEQFLYNNNSGSGVAVLLPSDTAYSVSVSGTRQGGSDNLSMTVFFYGLGPGTYTISDSQEQQGYAKVIMQLYNSTGSTYKAFSGVSGTLIVTEAGASGQPVTATFSGTFEYSDAQGGGSTQTVTISNGSIKAIRYQ